MHLLRRPRPFRRRVASLLVAAWLVLLWPVDPVAAYETDQHHHRHQPIRDSGPFFDQLVNAAIDDVVHDWRGPRDDLRFARQIYWRLGGLHWVDHIERQAMKNPDVDRLPKNRAETIFAGAPMLASRVVFFFGVGRTFRLHGVLVGSDKLGHFFSQGVKYYRRHENGWPEPRLLGWAAKVEKWWFGQWTTGVFSNADLVANYEGYRFYRSLFEDGAVAGKDALVRWQGDRPVIQRAFSFADHVNDFWDEALHPSHLAPPLRRYMRVELREFCPDFRQDPGAWVPRDEVELRRRYDGIGLRDATYLRLDHVCDDPPSALAGASVASTSAGPLREP